MKLTVYIAVGLGLAAVVVLIVIDFLTYLARSERFAVDTLTIEVTGAHLLGSDEICRASGLKDGVSLFAINADDVASRIEALARVRSADVSKQLPNHVTVSIEEREPVALVGRDELFEIDREGVVLGPPVEERAVAALPTICGTNMPARFVPGTSIDDPAVHEAVTLSVLLDATGTVPLLGVKTIDISDPENLVMHIEGVEAEIRWGIGDYERKLAKLLAVWNKCGGRLTHSEYIDLRQGKFVPAK